MKFKTNQSCWFSNAALLVCSLIFLWHSLFSFNQLKKFNRDPLQNLLSLEEQCGNAAAAFSCTLCGIALFGYMTITNIHINMMIIQIFFFLILIIAQLYSISFFHVLQNNEIKKVGNYIYSGVVMYDKANPNLTSKDENNLIAAHKMLYTPKLKCCGIYSWKDAESFKPVQCCPDAYLGEPGKGQCSNLYGHYTDSCLYIRYKSLIKILNRYTLTIFAMILTEMNAMVITLMAGYFTLNYKKKSQFFAWKIIKIIVLQEINTLS